MDFASTSTIGYVLDDCVFGESQPVISEVLVASFNQARTITGHGRKIPLCIPVASSNVTRKLGGIVTVWKYSLPDLLPEVPPGKCVTQCRK